jgi:hypothetical protein
MSGSNWAAYNNATINPTGGTVQITPSATQTGGYGLVTGPINLAGSILKYVVSVDTNFDVANMSLQTFYILDANTGVYDFAGCTEQSALIAGSDLTFKCQFTRPGNALPGGAGGVLFNIADTSKVRVGLQAQGGTVGGSFTVKSLTIAPPIPLPTSDANWKAIDGASIALSGSDIVVTPTALYGGAGYVVTGIPSFNGSSFTFIINPDATFVASGYDLQPTIQQAYAPYAGYYNCGYISSSALGAGIDKIVTCSNIVGTTWDTGEIRLKVLVNKSGTPPAPTGTFTIKKAFRNLAP